MYDEYSYAAMLQRQANQGNKVGFIYPNDKKMYSIMSSIDSMTMMDMQAMFQSPISLQWYCNTVATCAIESIIKSLNASLRSITKMNRFNFYDLFYIKVSNRINLQAEKEGNVNIAFQVAKDLISIANDPMAKVKIQQMNIPSMTDFFKIEIPNEDPERVKEINNFYIDIDRHARFNASNNYGIVIADNALFMSLAILYFFTINIILRLAGDLRSNPESNMESLNFNDIIEFHVVRSEENPEMFNVYMRPGLNAKLYIKSDEYTEDLFDDDDF